MYLLFCLCLYSVFAFCNNSHLFVPYKSCHNNYKNILLFEHSLPIVYPRISVVFVSNRFLVSVSRRRMFVCAVVYTLIWTSWTRWERSIYRLIFVWSCTSLSEVKYPVRSIRWPFSWRSVEPSINLCCDLICILWRGWSVQHFSIQQSVLFVFLYFRRFSLIKEFWHWFLKIPL